VATMKIVNRIEHASLRGILLSFALVVLGFAGAFRVLGLVGHGIKGDPGILDAIYFSFVTISTLGYGDFQPEGCGKALAVLEVLAGLLFVGIFVSRLVSARQEALLDFLTKERLADLSFSVKTDPEGPYSGQYAPLGATRAHSSLTDELILTGRYLYRLQAAIQRVLASDHIESAHILQGFSEATASSARVINNALEQIELGCGEFHRGDTDRIEMILRHFESIQEDLRKAGHRCVLTEVRNEVEVLRSHFDKLHSLEPDLRP